MPTKTILRPFLALAAVSALLALPAVAEATLTFVKNPMNPAVYTAGNDGSGVHKVGPGTNPHIAPDGESVAYFHEAPGHGTELKLAPVRGGAARTLMVGWREPFYLAFSPDSTMMGSLSR